MADDQVEPTTDGNQSDAGERDSAPETAPAPRKRAARARKTADSEPAAAEPAAGEGGEATPPAKKAAKKSTSKKAAAEKSTAKKDTAERSTAKKDTAERSTAKKDTAEKPAAKKATAKKKSTAKKSSAAASAPDGAADSAEDTGSADGAIVPLFQAPEPTGPARRRGRKPAAAEVPADAEQTEATAGAAAGGDQDSDDDDGGPRRRRRRGGRRRRKPGEGAEGAAAEDAADEPRPDEEAGDQDSDGSTRRRRRRRRSADDSADGSDDPANTVTRVRRTRSAEDQITAVSGSTRLEAKKQRRREGREAGRRRAPIVSEAEFLARRESVERVMVIRQRQELTQIAVLEDKVLVEHYVARESQTSLIGNVYLGRVQNVLPSMEAAFIDIGKGRNAVLYAGEVNWSALGHQDGQPRKIESVLSSGQAVLVQVTKDPVGHKGARLTSQISLAGRFLVYVPDGNTSGISRKLPDTERNRLKTLLKEIVPDSAGVIVRTAAEGASEDELTRDVERLRARWEDIDSKAKGSATALLYGEPDLTLKVVRDLFTEDFTRMVIEGDDAWDIVQAYVEHVAPDLQPRLQRHEPSQSGGDAFSAYRIDEQIAKGLDRKVWLPSGGSLIIDRTEAMTVVDVNTGKFTGSGGNLEETVTKNNLEAAEEMVRQLRLRDIGGIIVIDFIDMVLESNRDLVLRRLVECLGRDRTRHQVAEVTSLGLVQMTRKRIGTGLLEAFSQTCDHCQGRGLVLHDVPVEPKRGDDEARRGRRSRGRRSPDAAEPTAKSAPSPKDVAAHARPAVEEPQVEEPQVEELQVEELQVEEPQVEEPQVEEPPIVEPPTVQVEPEPAPVVVTRSRRRSASRPAGPPTTPGTATLELDAEEHFAAGETSTVEHVPVKRHRGRKR